MTEQTKTFTIKELIFYAYFAIMLIVKGFGLYQGQKIYTFALVISAGLIVFKLLGTYHSLYEWCVIVLLGLLGIAIYRYSNELGALIIVATIIGMKDVPVKRVMCLGCFLWTFTFFLRMLTTLLGLNRDIFKVQNKFHLGFIIRWSLGQPHPNVLQISFILFCAFILYAGRFKGKKLYAATFLMLLGNLYIFMYSLSITGIMLAFIYLGLNLYLQDLRPGFGMKEGLSLVEKIIFTAIVPVSALFSVLGPIVLTGRVWDFFNSLFNTRFNIAREYMRLNPITLFGTGYCNELPPELNNLDCSYVFALMHYGIIFFVLMITGYIALIVYQIRKNELTELAITVSMCIAAISEPFFVNPSFKNITWIFIGELLYIGLGRLNEIKALPGFCILKIGENEVLLPVDIVQGYLLRLHDTIQRFSKLIFGVSIMIGIILGCLYADIKQMPSAYYMNRDNVQVWDNGITIDINNLPEDFEGKILEYTGPETIMYRIDGNAVTAEYIRGIVSMIVWGFLVSAIVMTICICAKTEHGNGNNNISNSSGQ